MRPESRLTWLLPFLTGALVGCGTGFDPPSEVTTLRVLGVQKDNPMPQPGDRVKLSMLWHDGLVDPLDPEAQARDMKITWWLTEPEPDAAPRGCTNPPSQNFYGCLEMLATAQKFTNDEPTVEIGIAPDILDSLPPPREGQPLIGSTLVFFTICPGEVGFELPREKGDLPLVCRTADGTRLGPDSFMMGYTSLLTYKTEAGEPPITNQNPVVTGFEVRGATLVEDYCIDADCLEPAEALPIDCSGGEDPRCIPACEHDGDAAKCPEVRLEAVVDPESAELDQAAKTFFGREYSEQMWINYYVDRGSVRGEGVRLLNDATTGWNEEHHTEFYAPKEPGPVLVWAVVHDARGGQSWIRTRLQITGEEPAE